MVKLDTFDDVFSYTGDMGKSRVVYILFAVLSCMTPGWNHLLMTFIGASQGHWCSIPRLGNLSDSRQQYIGRSTYQKIRIVLYCIHYWPHLKDAKIHIQKNQHKN